jgi:hypothetical protein
MQGRNSGNNILPLAETRSHSKGKPTVSVVRVGATKQYSSNWDSIFTRGKKKEIAPQAKAKPASAKKKAKKKK